MKSLCVVLFLALLRCASSEEESTALPDFYLPDPEELNITETNHTVGYNPWMPQYTGGNPNKTTYVMMTGGCLPVDQNGSDFYQDASIGFWDACEKLDIECQCRPIISSDEWNVAMPLGNEDGIYGGIHHCSWEIRRILDEHRRGVIKLGGITAKCSLRNPEIYNEARELGVPVFLLGMNSPRPGEREYGLPEPDGYIGTDDEFFGRTLARLLKQLRPAGAIYAFIMAWESPSANRVRSSFNDEMVEKNTDNREVATWQEVQRYPYERPYNLSVECHHMTCQMEGLVTNRTIDALIYLFQSPVMNPNYTTWVDANRFRNLTHISMDALDFLHYLSQGYLDGLVGQMTYEMGTLSAQVLLDTKTKLESGELRLPLEVNFFETQLLAYNVIPPDLDKVHPPSLDQNLLGGLVYVGYTFLGIILVTSLFCAVWTVYNRSAIVVRAAQPFFLLIVVSGVVILSSTIIPLSFDDGGNPDSMSDKFAVGVCMSLPWLAFTGFTLVFAALFSKTWRVNMLFHSHQRQQLRVKVSLTDVLAPFAVIFTCNVIVLTCWTILDPLTYTRLSGEGTDFWNREIETYGACRSDTALAFVMPLAVINFMVLGIACWEAFKGRNIESAFSESKYIGLCVASLFQAFLTGFPILVLVKEEPRAFYLVLTLMIFVLSEGILLLIFVPKIYMAYTYSGMTESDQRKAMSEQIYRSTTNSYSLSTSSKILRAKDPEGPSSRKTPEWRPEAEAVAEGSHSRPAGTGGEEEAKNSNAASQTPETSRAAHSSVLSMSSDVEVFDEMPDVSVDLPEESEATDPKVSGGRSMVVSSTEPGQIHTC